MVGSPTDWAAMVPTISPGATTDLCHFSSKMSIMFCRACFEHAISFLVSVASIYACARGTSAQASRRGRIMFLVMAVDKEPPSLYLSKILCAGTEMAHLSPSLNFWFHFHIWNASTTSGHCFASY